MALIVVIIFIPDAYSIEIGFYAENGGKSAGLSSSYDVDTDFSVNEESTARFDHPTIENTRSISGTGDLKASQSYTGSDGYFGQTDLDASAVSGTFKGTACVSSSALSASQSGSFAGDSADISMSLTSKENSVYVGSGMTLGKITTGQSIWTGSAEGAQDTQLSGTASGYVDTGGYTLGDAEWIFDHQEPLAGKDGNLVYYQGVRADGTVVFSVDWIPVV